MELTSKQKLDLINSMEPWDRFFDGTEWEFISVEDNETNRDILHKIGITDEYLSKKELVKYGQIDIKDIGFKYANFYSSKNGRFMYV